MRTTVKLDQNVESQTWQQKTFHMGQDPSVPSDKALAMAYAMEDEEIIRKLALQK